MEKSGMSGPVLRFLDVGEMVRREPPPVPWLAPPVLPRGALTAVYAPGGDGKSLLMLALAAAIAHGGELAGIECEKGTAIYLDAENGEHEIHRRVHTLGVPPSGVMVADAGRLDLRRDMAELEELVQEMTPDLLVIDSLRAVSGGMDENDTAATVKVLDPLRRLAHESGTAIGLVHHANKAGREYRGASSIRDAVDVLWHLGRQEDDPDPHRRFLRNRKMRVAADGECLWLSLEVDRGRVLIDRAEPPEEQAATVLRPVRTMLSDEILAGIGERSLTLAGVAEMTGRRPKDGSVRNALAGLVASGQLIRHGNDYRKVQTVQSDDCTFAPGANGANPPSENAPEKPNESGRVQGAKVQTPLGGLALLHRPDASPDDGLDADAELARVKAKMGEGE
jgi:KaiC/GvpD/RAD55 family RecA-like ATPase